MRYVHRLGCAALIAFAVASFQAHARNDHAKGPPSFAGAAENSAQERPFAALGEASTNRFTAADNTVVRVFFARNPVVWTGLPPGIAKNYALGKPLPPGIAKNLPADLLARLPERRGFQYARVGQDVALIDTTTRIVADLIEHVFD